MSSCAARRIASSDSGRATMTSEPRRSAPRHEHPSLRPRHRLHGGAEQFVVEDRARRRRGEGERTMWRPRPKASRWRARPRPRGRERKPLDGRRPDVPAGARAGGSGNRRVVPTETILKPEAVNAARPKRRGTSRRRIGAVQSSSVSILVTAGEVVGLLGPNGAGSDNVLDRRRAGRARRRLVLLDEQDVTTLPMYRRARRGLGYLPRKRPSSGR